MRHESNTSKLFGQRVSFLRKKRKITQAKLAAEAGIDYRHYQDIEAGKVNISLQTIESIASVLSVRSCYLLSSEVKTRLNDLDIYCPADILDKLNCGVHVCDADGTVCYDSTSNGNVKPISATDKVGNLEEDIKLWHFPRHAEERDRLKYLFFNTVAGRSMPAVFHSVIESPTGSPASVSMHYNPIIGVDSRVLGYVLVTVPRA
jgi:transcriptional regulator with XRE-family HTH domain